MDNVIVSTIFGLLGGLALFLFGMNMMSEGLQKVAGERMRAILGLLTKNTITGVLAGAIVTAVLQSSSATTVMAIGFVSAGLLKLPQAISIIFGANIGTTMTAQLIAFKLSDYIWPIIFFGFLVYFFSKKEYIKYIGETVFAFGLLFLGIDVMGDVMKPLANSPVFISMIEQVSDIPVLGVLAERHIVLVFGNLDSALLHRLSKLVCVNLTLATADNFAYAGHEKVGCGNCLAVRILLHIERLDILRIVGYKHGLVEHLFGKVTLVLGL